MNPENKPNQTGEMTCQNCGKTFGEHFALRCKSGSDESVWKPSPAFAYSPDTVHNIIEIEVIHLKALRKIHGVPWLDKVIANLEFALKPAAPPADKPTFAYSLAMYLTRNGQQGNAPDMQKGIEQFMKDKGEVR